MAKRPLLSRRPSYIRTIIWTCFRKNYFA